MIMGSGYSFATHSSLLLLFIFVITIAEPSAATTRKLTALVQQQPLTLKYHNGALLKGNVTVNLIWYGKFTPIQRSIIVDFLLSLKYFRATLPSAALWWSTTEKYKGGSSTLVIGKQILDENLSLGKNLKNSHLIALASKAGHLNSVNVVLTAKDVTVEGFCMRCGTHGSTRGKTRFTYAWVGNSETQCPATVTNPYNNGYFQGPPDAPLEAVSACTGVFGSGAYPGYAGQVLVDKTTGASYNANGVNGRKYLVPAMWDPRTSACSTLV
ncbi:hypothetical protein F0562_028920 [Nyssa sinensis]|uniref:Neprosin domain-containing protein n=1 Tax=Nyssa sinensis TaxID=561372 RepID=A0A5J5B3J0_9ASTE|nr:hypothetical protein F0562_028920 [Nyssa sinensis]